MTNETLKLFLDNLKKAAEYNRVHDTISVERYAAVWDVAFALESAIDAADRE
jgi:hypothetical protein